MNVPWQARFGFDLVLICVPFYLLNNYPRFGFWHLNEKRRKLRRKKISDVQLKENCLTDMSQVEKIKKELKIRT